MAAARTTKPKVQTKWGDRTRRRADILGAARARITESGYLSLNMRDLAADAGISPATLYSYFATKEELFATLYVEAIRAHTDVLRTVVEHVDDLPTLLERVIGEYLELYRSFGRHFTLWTSLRHDVHEDAAPFPRELIVELRGATLANNELLMGAIRDSAARDGQRIVDDELVPAFLWSAMNGLADHFTSERRSLDPFPPDRLLRFAARRLAVAITV